MPPDDGMPAWASILLNNLETVRTDVQNVRTELNARIDRLATVDQLVQEGKRVDQRIDSLGRELGEERAARISADGAMARDINEAATKAEAAETARRKDRTTLRNGLIIGLAPIALGGIGTAVVWIIQNIVAVH